MAKTISCDICGEDISKYSIEKDGGDRFVKVRCAIIENADDTDVVVCGKLGTKRKTRWFTVKYSVIESVSPERQPFQDFRNPVDTPEDVCPKCLLKMLTLAD